MRDQNVVFFVIIRFFTGIYFVTVSHAAVDPRVRRSDCRSSCAKNHAVPTLFACKRALSASACCGRFAGWCRGPFLAFFLQRNAHTESLGTQSACGAFFFAHGFSLALIAGCLYLCSNPRRLLFFRKTRTAPHARRFPAAGLGCCAFIRLPRGCAGGFPHPPGRNRTAGSPPA